MNIVLVLICAAVTLVCEITTIPLGHEEENKHGKYHKENEKKREHGSGEESPHVKVKIPHEHGGPIHGEELRKLSENEDHRHDRMKKTWKSLEKKYGNKHVEKDDSTELKHEDEILDDEDLKLIDSVDNLCKEEHKVKQKMNERMKRKHGPGYTLGDFVTWRWDHLKPGYVASTLKDEDYKNIATASSGLLDELNAEHDRLFTRSSEYYDKAYYQDYLKNPRSPSKSISSDYASWEKNYDEYMAATTGKTTQKYIWWTYDVNNKCTFNYSGIPLDVNRMLYSIKMSSLMPNISREISEEYKNSMNLEYAEKIEKERKAWAATLSDASYNADDGPIPGRRELKEPFEIAYNKYLDVEMTMHNKFEKDVKHYLITPVVKGLYHFKKWLNPKYYTTTKKRDLTWPESCDTQEFINHYKNWLKVDKNISVPDHVQKSVFDKYRFTADSNYYSEYNDPPSSCEE